jgi:hypothetical protein
MSDDLVKRLRDWSEYDEGKINDAREEAADRIEELTAFAKAAEHEIMRLDKLELARKNANDRAERWKSRAEAAERRADEAAENMRRAIAAEAEKNGNAILAAQIRAFGALPVEVK